MEGAVHDGQVGRRKNPCFRFCKVGGRLRKLSKVFQGRVTMDASRFDALEELPELERDSRSGGGVLLDLFDARHPYLIVRKMRTSYFGHRSAFKGSQSVMTCGGISVEWNMLTDD